MEKRQRRGLCCPLPFCSHVLSGLIPDSVDNRITALSEPTPLAAAERPSVASRERGSGRAPDAVFSPYASVRHFTPHMVLFSYNLH